MIKLRIRVVLRSKGLGTRSVIDGRSYSLEEKGFVKVEWITEGWYALIPLHNIAYIEIIEAKNE